MMISLPTSQKNKKHVENLLRFGKKIVTLLEKNGVKPILYGSLLFVTYTKDKETTVNDLDFYITEKEFKRVVKILTKEKIAFVYSPEWHTLSITQGKCKIELDSKDYWYKGLCTFETINFAGIALKALSKESLTALYKRAAAISDQPEKNREKYLALLKSNS